MASQDYYSHLGDEDFWRLIKEYEARNPSSYEDYYDFNRWLAGQTGSAHANVANLLEAKERRRWVTGADGQRRQWDPTVDPFENRERPLTAEAARLREAERRQAIQEWQTANAMPVWGGGPRTYMARGEAGGEYARPQGSGSTLDQWTNYQASSPVKHEQQNTPAYQAYLRQLQEWQQKKDVFDARRRGEHVYDDGTAYNPEDIWAAQAEYARSAEQRRLGRQPQMLAGGREQLPGISAQQPSRTADPTQARDPYAQRVPKGPYR